MDTRKVLVIVRGGVAEVYAEEGVDFLVVDRDNDPHGEIPGEYAWLIQNGKEK
jgi:hypothetical protein